LQSRQFSDRTEVGLTYLLSNPTQSLDAKLSLGSVATLATGQMDNFARIAASLKF
ncbi:MAG: hypothetical protein JKY27_09000, partial [Magnetovibrio sp.]|nr:hypothetical protein [Magnetovibrio sp.]